jgi:hypothetical protein
MRNFSSSFSSSSSNFPAIDRENDSVAASAAPCSLAELALAQRVCG